jgi:hypothetical protein
MVIVRDELAGTVTEPPDAIVMLPVGDQASALYPAVTEIALVTYPIVWINGDAAVVGVV